MTEPNSIIEHGTLDDFEIPKIVYKYRDWEDDFHKRFITHNEVFMASARTFEDQLDCNNPTRFDRLTKRQIYEYFLWTSKNENAKFTRQQHRHFARDWAKRSPVNKTKFVKEFMENSIQQYYDHEGILSLTENWDNDDMWSEYANNETGFCIGYNSRIMFEHLGGGGIVEYVDEIPIIMPEPFMESIVAMRNRVYYKLLKYSYEEEYRAKMFWPSPATVKQRQIVLPSEAINCIILGNNISKKHEEEIIINANKFIGKIDIVKRKDY